MSRFRNGGNFGTRLTGGFRHIEANAHTDIQDRNAEWFLYIPMVVKPNWPSRRDEARKTAIVRGTFSWESALQRMGMRENEVVTRNPKIAFSRCDLETIPQRGDIFRREVDGNDFEVGSVEKDGFTGLIANLVQLGKQS